MPPELEEVQNRLLSHLTADDDEPLGGDNNTDQGDEDDDDAGEDTDDDGGDQDQRDDDPDGDNDRDEPSRRDAEDEDEPRRQRQDDRDTDPVAAADRRFNFKQDAKGNLVDRQGKVLFAAGKPRQIFQTLKKALKDETTQRLAVIVELRRIAGAGQELLKKYKELRDKPGVGKEYGLDDTEQRDALELMALAKRDPKAAVRSILTKLHFAGADLKDIGVTAPVDAREIARHTLEMQEAREAQKLKDRREQLRQEAREERDSFFARNPRALPYEGMIADAKRRFPQMELDDIWTQLVRSARKAREGKERNGDDRRREVHRPSRDMPPNNRRGSSGGRISNDAADPSLSFKQIGRELLRDIRNMER